MVASAFVHVGAGGGAITPTQGCDDYAWGLKSSSIVDITVHMGIFVPRGTNSNAQ